MAAAEAMAAIFALTTRRRILGSRMARRRESRLDARAMAGAGSRLSLAPPSRRATSSRSAAYPEAATPAASTRSSQARSRSRRIRPAAHQDSGWNQ